MISCEQTLIAHSNALNQGPDALAHTVDVTCS